MVSGRPTLIGAACFKTKRMKRIWKYPIKQPGQTTLLVMPYKADVVDVQLKDEAPFMWVCFDTEEIEAGEPVQFNFFATGEDIPEGWHYINTVHYKNGLVYHLFEYAP